MPEKEFIIWIDEGRILTWRDIREGEVLAFRVVLLVDIGGERHCVARYDTAHGAPHQDILGRTKGTLEKRWFYQSSYEKVFAYAIRDIEAHAQEYIRFYWEN